MLEWQMTGSWEASNRDRQRMLRFDSNQTQPLWPQKKNTPPMTNIIEIRSKANESESRTTPMMLMLPGAAAFLPTSTRRLTSGGFVWPDRSELQELPCEESISWSSLAKCQLDRLLPIGSHDRHPVGLVSLGFAGRRANLRAAGRPQPRRRGRFRQ